MRRSSTNPSHVFTSHDRPTVVGLSSRRSGAISLYDTSGPVLRIHIYPFPRQLSLPASAAEPTMASLINQAVAAVTGPTYASTWTAAELAHTLPRDFGESISSGGDAG